MPYLRFTKVIIHHFISKDNTFSMRNKINLYTARDDTLLGTLKFVSKTEDYQKYGALIPDGMINHDIKDSKAYKNYLDYATRKVPPKKARKFKNPASPKLKIVPASPKEPTRKGKRVKRAAKNATTTPTTGVVIRDTPGKSVSKKKAPAKTDRGKGIDEEKSDDVHDEDDNDNEDGNDDDSGNDAQDSEQTDLDDGENPFFTLKDYEEEEQYEEYVLTPERDKAYDEDKIYEEEDDDVAKELYGDLNITQGLRDIDMTNAEQGGEDQQNASYESGFVQEEEDAHVTLTTVHDKTEGPLQSSSISSDFTSKLLNLDDPSLDINSLMKTSTVTSPPPSVNPSSHPTTISQQQTPDSTTTTIYPTMTLPEIPNFASDFQSNLYKALVESYNTDKDILSTYGDVVTLKRGRDDQDKDEDPSARSDRGMKRRKSSKDAEPPKGSKSKESKSSSSSKGTQSQPKSFGRSTQAEEPKFKVADTEMQQNQGNESGHIDDQPDNEAAPKQDCTIAKECYKERQPPHTFDELMGTPIDFLAYVMNRLKIENLTQEILVGSAFNLFKGTCKSFAELEYHFKECYKAVNDRLDWKNPERHKYLLNLSKPLPLIEDRGRQVVPTDYFINNDLEYLKARSSSSKYATSTTRTKAAKYDNIKGIEDMVLTLWSPVKVAYNKHVVWGTYH
nr:hypothetical protein [Tanacetum cinerariifolium]